MKKKRVFKLLGRRFAKRRNTYIFIVALGIFLTGIFTLWITSLPLPDFGSFEERKIIESTKIYDRTREVVLYDVHKEIKRTLVPFSNISRHVKNATVAIEDSEFYEHRGIKISAIVRAFFANITARETIQGGSTITQQVIKNTLLSKEKRLSRKIKEAVLALKLERSMNKDEILNIYLNESPYGGNIYGIEEASQEFFGKKAQDVTLSESAYLASLPQAPTYFSPYGPNRENLDERKNIVLDRMAKLDYITNEEAAAAKNEKVSFSPPTDRGIKAPHFVMYIQQYLEEKYGRELLESGGLKVTTTLNWDLQAKAQETVTQFAVANEKNYNAKNAGMVAVDPKTGQILVMVGSRDYFDIENDGNFNVAIAYRQPGSAFKPFVYATSFKKGYTPETVVFDLKTQFSTTCDAYGTPLPGSRPDSCYMPENYDLVFRGPVTLREALAQSINIPSVKTLYLAGLRDSLETARDMGITTLNDINRYGLTLVLGGGEVTLLEMTSAYSVFANDGLRNPHTAILKIEDKNGHVLEEFQPKTKKVLEENIARQINDVLSDNVARTPAFTSDSPLYIPGRQVAAKTGTTNNYRDAWIVGYTPNIAVGAWAGNNDNTSMEKKVAGFIVAPMWNAFMKEILNDLEDVHFVKPQIDLDPETTKPVLRGVWNGGKNFFIDSISGKLATEYTPEETKKERILNGVHSILYWVKKEAPRGDAPGNPANDPQFLLWETKVREWAETRGIQDENESAVPHEYDDVHVEGGGLLISFISPNESRVYTPNQTVVAEVTVSGKYNTTQVDFFLNEVFLGSVYQPPYKMSFTPEDTLPVVTAENILTIRAYDSVRNVSQKDIRLILTPLSNVDNFFLGDRFQ